jgi:hypothetical protein
MPVSNFCINCGARLTRKGWRVWLRGPVCDDCALRSGQAVRRKPVIAIAMIAIGAFSIGRYLRPAPPPLIIQRAANSPLSDLPINLDELAKRGDTNSNRKPAGAGSPVDETVYLCGARTQKGTPCRRRVHVLGQRCYQHKDRPAMVSLEKLTIKP